MIGGAVAVMAVPAFAQQATAGANGETTVKEVVVTGSRIPRPNTTAVSPVQTVSQQEFKQEGVVDTETLLNNLPSVSPSASQFSNNGASGIATVDLRGFGANRTLVLIDGHRMPPGDPQQPVADLNLIPSSLVDSVDVLTGGASSIYGSDAIAGVVNFRMKHNFTGLQIDAQEGIHEHDNGNALGQAIAKAAGHQAPTDSTWQGRTDSVTITFGANSEDHKGNLEGFFGYINQEPVRQSAYDYAYCAVSGGFSKINGKSVETSHVCGGSGNSAYGNFVGKFWGSLDANGVFNPGPTQSSVVNLSNNPGAAGNFVAYGSAPPGASSRAFNYAPYQYFMRQDTRYQGGYFAHYDLNSHIQVYSDFLFEDDQSTGQLGPSGQFTNNGAINQITCDNPLASASQLAALCGPAPYQLNQTGQVVAVGDSKASSPIYGGAGSTNLSQPFGFAYRLQNDPRDYLLTHNSYKIDEGVKGDIDDVWSYDGYIQFGKSQAESKTVGDVSKQRINTALQVGTNGQCIAGGSCVPFNIFTPLSQNVSPAAFSYLEEDSNTSGYTTEQVASLNLVGKLGKYGLQSPWAVEGVGLAVGAEYRRDYLSVSPDAASQSGDLAGASPGGNKPTQGAVSVKDLYTELSLPLVADRFLMKDVSLDLAYRRSDYNLAGSSDTYKFGGDWQITRDIRFRGAFNRTERAPNVLELFRPQIVGNSNFSDPCSGSAPTATAQQCYNTAKNLAALGFDLANFTKTYYGHIPVIQAGQANGKTGGNPNLKPEIADTTTLGLVFTPTFFRGFYASVDYWDINVLNAISTQPFATTLNSCLADGNSPACNMISRSLATGGFDNSDAYVSGIKENISGLHRRGWDMQADYRFRLRDTGFLPDWGGVNLDFVGTYLDFAKSAFPNGTLTDPKAIGVRQCAGLFGPICGLPEPRWRHKFRATWNTPWNVDLSMQWRYIQAEQLDVNSSDPILNNGLRKSIIDGQIPAYSYIDLSVAWRVRSNISIRAGVNNVFDKDPPILDTNVYPITTGAGNTFPNLYDPLGRTIFVNLTGKF